MSLDAMTWAWKQQLRSSEKLVLLSMADRAGEDHKCYPSIARLTKDTCLNRKTVTSVMGRLRDAGLIVKTGRMVGSNLSVPEYRLVGVRGREEDVAPTRPKNGHSPKTTHAPNLPDPKTGIAPNRAEGLTRKRVDHQTQKRVTEPSIEPPMESLTSYTEFETVSTRSIIICTLPLNDGSHFEVSEAFVSELAPLYPNVDVVQALRAMKGWLIGNPKRRKTRRGITAFITNWLSREQDKPRAVQSGAQQGAVATQAAQPRSYRDCVDLEQRQETSYLQQLQEQLDGTSEHRAN